MTRPAPTPPAERPLLLSIRAAAALLGISPGTVRKLCDDGTIDTSRLGRRRMVRRASLERLAASSTTTTAEVAT